MKVVHPDDHDVVIRRIKQSVEERVELPFIKERLIKENGQTFFAEVLGTPITYNEKPAMLLIAKEIVSSL